MDDHMMPVRAQQVGDSRFARFLLRDEIGQYFTGSGWTDEPGGAALYCRPTDALEARNRFYVEGDHDQDTFTAIIVVRAVTGDWTAEELAEHLRQWGKFIVRPSGERRGVVVEIDWDGLRKAKDREGEPPGYIR
jgi:hypothetical protein